MSDQLSNMMPWPAEDFSVYGPVEAKPMGKIQGFVAKAMHRNWVCIPHVTHNDDVDITGFEARRKAWNAANPDKKRTLLPALIQGSVELLKQFPQFNTSISPDGATLYQKDYYNIGIAVDVPSGLLVPVLKNCDQKNVDEIAGELVAISDKAKTKGLSMAEMSGGCFTLSSLGHIGGTSFSPIINAPEVAILGITRAKQRFLPDAEGNPELHTLLPLSLSYDHRIINGADAARFCQAMGKFLAEYEFA
ncbi:2-oxo acid dehydrogenase subunit E2 [Pseudomaricurvus sp. HS19]|uniref:2-oxo acid dehydrogenase subunit E2 n=1 Tax=Pseudomaricurvus sp. HS19 TaxID=2692626 RepID=UPI00137149C3|nr:2-oxo acid dehydrogenase subunit E2 [Pseudomaricurvus sp. HS19]MYM64049.1 dihydrolipoamide acetyltransferase [Pseudomaricurvus sp. HS19]